MTVALSKRAVGVSQIGATGCQKRCIKLNRVSIEHLLVINFISVFSVEAAWLCPSREASFVVTVS